MNFAYFTLNHKCFGPLVKKNRIYKLGWKEENIEIWEREVSVHFRTNSAHLLISKPVPRVHKDCQDSKSGQIVSHTCYNVTYYKEFKFVLRLILGWGF